MCIIHQLADKSFFLFIDLTERFFALARLITGRGSIGAVGAGFSPILFFNLNCEI